MTVERRILIRGQRAVGTSQNPVIEGYAVIFDTVRDLANFRERITKGAFLSVLESRPDVVAVLNNNLNRVLARTTAGTLKLRETDKGLYYVAEIDPGDSSAMDIYKRVRRGTISSAAIAFTVRSEQWAPPAGKLKPLRTITDIAQLFWVGPCVFGVSPEVSAIARKSAARIVRETARRELFQLRKNNPSVRMKK